MIHRLAVVTVFALAATTGAVTLTPIQSATAATLVTMDGSALLNSTGPGVPELCGKAPAVPYASDGDPLTIHMPPGPDFTVGSIPSTWWRTPPTPDPVWQLAFKSLIWAQPAAYSADYNNLAASYADLVTQVIAFYSQNPDPGASTATALANANRWGWDEGTSLRRLTTLNCLYSLRADARLIPLMRKEVNVQVCPRYYGPPCHSIHNHAMMANEAIYQAGDLTNNATWQKTAADRMKAEVPQVFDSYGFAREQSAGYQLVNVTGWGNGANLLRVGHPAQAAVIDTALARGRKAGRWLTQPDGRLAQLGGGSNDISGLASPVVNGVSVIDDGYGWAIGRWSWTDRNTMWYAVRYGPARAFHGTQDRAGVSWSDWGNRILVEPGTYGSLTTDPYVKYQNLPTSQNVAVPSVIPLSNQAVQRVRGATNILSTSHSFTWSDNLWPGRPHSRYVAFHHGGTSSHKAVIRDTFKNDPTKSATNNYVRQWFHLDPTWTLHSQSTSRAVFKSANGRTLTMASNGNISSIQRGVTGASPRGWHFPKWQTKQASLEICIRRYMPGSTQIETTFVVS